MPEWLDWNAARPELAVLDSAGLLTFADVRRSGKLLSSRKTDCEARLLAGVRAHQHGTQKQECGCVKRCTCLRVWCVLAPRPGLRCSSKALGRRGAGCKALSRWQDGKVCILRQAAVLVLSWLRGASASSWLGVDNRLQQDSIAFCLCWPPEACLRDIARRKA